MQLYFYLFLNPDKGLLVQSLHKRNTDYYILITVHFDV